jgi:hypothetical protein
MQKRFPDINCFIFLLFIYRKIALQVQKRFPDMASLLTARLIYPHEAERLAKVQIPDFWDYI